MTRATLAAVWVDLQGTGHRRIAIGFLIAIAVPG
jgi:hypothetical protein